jgi:DNA-binding MarR family transcriptional regulator
MAASRTRRAGRSPDPARVLQVAPAVSVELDAALLFMRALWVAVHAVQTTSKRMNARLGVTGPQRLVLRVVGLAPGISAGGLATVLHLHPSTLTGVLKRLEKQRLLSRAVHAADGRRAVLRLTAQGRRYAAPVDGTVEAAARATMAMIPARDQAKVRDALELLAEHLNGRPAARVDGPRRRTGPA